MTSDHSDSHDTDSSLANQLRHLPPILRHPVVIGFLAVAAGAALFLMGRSIGAAIYSAFDGDGTSAVVFGVVLAAVLLIVVSTGVVLDRRRRRRHDSLPPRRSS